MDSSSKNSFRICILWIATCLAILTIGPFLPFELTDKSKALFLYIVIWITFPLALSLLPISCKRGNEWKALKIVGAITSFIALGLLIFSRTMCGYTTDRVLFVNKSDTSFRIIKRHYDCGAFDSNTPEFEFYKTKVLTSQILYQKQIDTSKIKSDEWIKLIPAIVK